MRYRNTVTGAIIDSPCTLSGGDWVEETGAEVALEDMNAKQLKEVAEQMQVDLKGVTKKADILEAIQLAVENTEKEEGASDEEEGQE